MVITQAKTGIYFTIRIRFAAYLRFHRGILLERILIFGEMSLKNTAI